MDLHKKIIHLKIRRFDQSDNPQIIKKSIELPDFISYKLLKTDLRRLCGISEDKVMKIRNEDGVLIPISFLVESSNKTFLIDIANISYVSKNESKLLQDAYVDAVQQKIQILESRVTQSELLLPQLEWRRQAYMEETINALTNKVGFLNRRFDVLLPQYKSKLTETIS